MTPVQISQLLHQLQFSTPLARSQRPTEPYKQILVVQQNTQ